MTDGMSSKQRGIREFQRFFTRWRLNFDFSHIVPFFLLDHISLLTSLCLALPGQRKGRDPEGGLGTNTAMFFFSFLGTSVTELNPFPQGGIEEMEREERPLSLGFTLYLEGDAPIMITWLLVHPAQVRVAMKSGYSSSL